MLRQGVARMGSREAGWVAAPAEEKLCRERCFQHHGQVPGPGSFLRRNTRQGVAPQGPLSPRNAVWGGISSLLFHNTETG